MGTIINPHLSALNVGLDPSQVAAAVAAVRGGDGIVAHTPDPTKYHDPSVDPGLAAKLPSSGKTVMIPRAVDDGRMPQVGPNGRIGSRIIQIDPQFGGPTIDLSQMTKQIAAESSTVSSNYEDRRMGAYAAWHTAAKRISAIPNGTTPGIQVAPAAAQPVVVQAAPPMQQEVATPSNGIYAQPVQQRVPQQQANGSLFDSFNTKQASVQVAPQDPMACYSTPPVPTVKVTFEQPGWGKMKATYESVYISRDSDDNSPNGFVVTYDLAGEEPLLPDPGTDEEGVPRILAARIDGDNTVYLLSSTGLSHVCMGKRHVIYIVRRSAVQQG